MRITLAIFFCSSLLFCGHTEDTGMITYRILESDLRLTSDTQYLQISIELVNTTNENFILYGFQRSTYLLMSDSGLCANPPGAGNALFIIDSLGNEMPEEFYLDEMHGDDYLRNPVTEDSLFNVFRKITSEYTSGKEVLKSGQKKNAKLRFDINANPPVRQLKPGEYQAYFVYYAADDLTRTVEEGPVKVSMVDEAVMKSDVRKYGATVFNGWVRSNKVRLVVE